MMTLKVFFAIFHDLSVSFFARTSSQNFSKITSGKIGYCFCTFISLKMYRK